MDAGIISGSSFSRLILVLMRASPPEKNRKRDFVDARNCNFSTTNIILIVVFFTPFPLAKQKRD